MQHVSQRLSGKTGVLVGLAFLPLVWSMLVHTAWPSKPQSMTLPRRPALVFHQYQVNLGRIQPTTEVRGTFVFENRGTETVKITHVEPSCGCLQPQLSVEQLAPGESGAIVLRMQPANELPGQKEYFADIRYTDPEPQEVRVTFRLELPEQQMSVKPRALVIYQTSDQPTTHPLSVSDTRPQPATVKSAAINQQFAKVELLGTEDSPDFGLVTRLQVTISPELPAGRHEAVVTIHTDDPQSPVLRVPVLMHGRSRQ